MAPCSNGPESSTSAWPPSSPLALTCSESSSSPLLTPARLAFSITFCGSSSLLLLPPQAAKVVASAARIANSAKNRIRLKRWGSSYLENRTRWILGTGRWLLPRAPHPGFDFLDCDPHHRYTGV